MLNPDYLDQGVSLTIGWESFEAMYRSYYPRVLATARHRVSDRTTAEDITQDVFRAAAQRHRAGHTVDTPWLFATVRNLIGNEYRRAQRAAALSERIEAAASIEARPGEASPDTAIDVTRAMVALAENDREILQLAYWDDLSGNELAAALGISPGAARVRLTRAKQALRALLDTGSTPPTPHTHTTQASAAQTPATQTPDAQTLGTPDDPDRDATTDDGTA
jgi:RNA polymerase sigma-70 factor (ECF subfamily)